MPLSKAQIKLARKKIENYHRQKLDDLLGYVVDKINVYKQGKLDIFELDHIIHIYHKQSQELFAFINTFYTHNDMLETLLNSIKEEEEGKWKWEPRTKQE